MVAIEGIIYYLVLLDSIGANIVSWCCTKWYKKSVGKWAKHFPASRGWALWYFVLVLWIGSLMNRIGMIPWFFWI